jgi:hypothetical protein
MDIEPDTGYLWPIVYPSEFWLLKEHLISLENASISELPLAMSYSPIGFFKWQIQVGVFGCVCVGRGGGGGEKVMGSRDDGVSYSLSNTHTHTSS